MSKHADPKTNVVTVLQERGLMSQLTESGLPEAAAGGQLYVYCGFDATAPSLQVGNLVPVMALAHFQRHGHRPIIVVGGGTSMIGDPSGKSVERPLLTAEQIAEYAGRIRDQLAGYLSFEGPAAAILVNNADWLSKMTLIEYLRDIGKHFSVNAMSAKESVRSRLEDREHGISYTEFSYMVVQATDFLHLNDTYNCTVQIGGHDQWGNLTAGVDLIRKAREKHVHALTVPLITSASGAKFGKTAGNAIWLDPAMTTPYALYQYWINIDDRDVAHYLKVFTFQSLDDIATLEREQEADPSKRVGQRVLAFELTKLIHGEDTARAVEAASRVLFGGGVDELTPEALMHLASAVPTVEIEAAALERGIPVLDALVTSGAQPSKGAARRVLQQGGLYVNDARWSDAEGVLTREQALFGRAILLRTGKNKYSLLLAK
ncbi:MAG: Tyrosyl-tRNA synthetase [Ktedonobacterales bacterium]|jgi:tyrosyl-tRNA synthetase|nr:MAG: Tyrosyl-tRNA synthetase [Ktedonobacterales bacterium]